MMADKKITTEDAEKNLDFHYQQAREYLVHTIDNIKSLKNKATLLLGFLLSVIAFAIPIIFRDNDDYTMSFKCALVFIVGIYILVSLLLIYGVILPINDHQLSGNEPDTIVNLSKKHDTKELHEASPASRLIADVLLDYEEKIRKNIKIADKKNKIIRRSLFIVIVSPLIISGIFYLLSVAPKQVLFGLWVILNNHL